MTEAYPLKWPDGWSRTPDRKRETYSRFSTTFAKAHANLMRELRMLGASAVVVSSWLPLRNDGKPRADAARVRLEDPGVAVYFRLRDRPMVMARDGYTNVHDNLHSIGHAIGHLRGLERHAGAMMMERAFSGFAALPAPETASARHWIDVLGRPGNWRELAPETQRAWIEGRYRELVRTAHPDTAEGSDVAFIELQRAKTEAMANVGQPLP